MTLLKFHGFEGYDNPWTQMQANDLIISWNGNQMGPSYLSYQTGRNGGKAVRHDGEIFAASMSIGVASSDTIIIGFAFKATERVQVGAGLVYFDIGYGYFILDIPNSKSENFQFKIYTGATVHLDYIPYDINKWYYIECKFRVHDTLGIAEVRMNEQIVSTYSGDTHSNLDPFTIANLTMGFPKASGQLIDDFYMCDDQGAEHNDYLGDIRIDAIHPNGAGNYAQFTPSAGANYECVDETEMDDTDYVSHLTVGEKDSYAYADVPTDLDDVGIIGLQIKNNAKRTATADNIKLDPFIRIGSTDYSQTAVDLPDEFGKTDGDITLLDPSDVSDWTQAKINACEFGMEVN